MSISAFSCIVVLAGLSTWIDLAKHRDVPSPFGTQHVALVLIGWGPLFVFGVYNRGTECMRSTESLV